MTHDHRHILLKATGLRAAPTTTAEVEDWLDRLVAAVRMKVLVPPAAVRCDTPGNEGVTGVVVIETSHASLHVWERPGHPDGAFAQADLYSCATFGSGEFVRLVQRFAPAAMSWTMVDRNGPVVEVLEMGEMSGQAVPA